MATTGVSPRIMGIGPAPASQKLLKQLGMTIDQMDVIELNEAFASQGIAVLRQLGVADTDHRSESIKSLLEQIYGLYRSEGIPHIQESLDGAV